MASIRQAVSAAKGREPAHWLVSMPQYEADGRLLRDSPDPRLIAFAPGDRRLYATDGCNCCARTVDADLAAMDDAALERLSSESGIARPLLERLIAMTRES
jgi:hypothetical protein